MQNSELNWGKVARTLKDKADAMERAAESLGRASADNDLRRDMRNRAAILDSLAEAIWSGLY
jgi:cytochrome c551/c552